jgi:hypothetical protein
LPPYIAVLTCGYLLRAAAGLVFIVVLVLCVLERAGISEFLFALVFGVGLWAFGELCAIARDSAINLAKIAEQLEGPQRANEE